MKAKVAFPLVIRPIALSDLEGLESCSEAAGTCLVNLPKCRSKLKQKIETSVASLKTDVVTPGGESYLFVLSHAETGEICGTCGIIARAGLDIPYYVYRVNEGRRELNLIRYDHSVSEICALYLAPQWRGGGMGKLLSLSRFLFMAAHPQRFAPSVIASLCGVEEDGISRFWQGVGYPHTKLRFDDAMRRRALNPDVTTLLSNQPTTLAIDEDVWEVTGQPQDTSRPAYNLLTREGFKYAQDVDPFDGGPILSVTRGDIRTIRKSDQGLVGQIATTPSKSSIRCLIANDRLDFRACYATVEVVDGKVILERKAAESLEVKEGDAVRYLLNP